MADLLLKLQGRKFQREKITRKRVMLTWVSITLCSLIPNWKYSAWSKKKIMKLKKYVVNTKCEHNKAQKNNVTLSCTSLSLLQSWITFVTWLDSSAGLQAWTIASPPSMASTKYTASGNANCKTQTYNDNQSFFYCRKNCNAYFF